MDNLYVSSVQTTIEVTSNKMGPKKDPNQDLKKRKCTHFDRGYCKFGDKCHKKHPDKVCSDTNCFNETCELRHPNP